MALLFFVYLVHLKPDLFDEYVLNTVGRGRGGNPLVQTLLGWLAVSVLILVPALFAGWATRGYRLKLTPCLGDQSVVTRRD
jgi:hypothetical protein